MIDSRIQRSPQFYARAAGLLYLYIIIAGTFAEVFVRGRLVDVRDASVTARNIVAQENLFRVGMSAELLHLACDVAVTVILYLLLTNVHRPLAAITFCMRFACILIIATVSVTQFAALRLVRPADYLAGLDAAQRESLAVLAMQLHSDGYTVSLMFFGFGCISLGYLIYRSTYLPRLLGVMMAVAGVCYLVNSFAHFLRLGIASKLFPGLFIPIFVAELALSLWLLVRGVNSAAFERATASTGGAQ